METTIRNINVSLPVEDMKFFKELVKKMGWSIEKGACRKSKSPNAVTMKAINEARTGEAVGTIDTSNYDSFVKSIIG